MRIFIDNSGSTAGCPKYWDGVLTIVNANPTAEVFFWNSVPVENSVPRAKAVAMIENRTGTNGTNPLVFAHLARENSDIIIITDGQVGPNEVQVTDNQLRGRQFNSVGVYFINTGGAINMSCAAPYTRKTDYHLYIDGKSFSAGSSKNPIALSVYMNNPEKFLTEAESLLQKITIQNMGAGNIPLRNELLDLQKNLMNQIANAPNTDDPAQKLRTLLTSGSYHEALAEVKNLASNGDSSVAVKVQTAIAEMTKTCEGKGGFDFSQMESGRLARAAAVKVIGTEELPTVEDFDSIECPISYEEDLPVLLIKKGTPVLAELDKSYVEAILTNPFLVLNDNKLVEAIRARLDHPFGFTSVQDLFKHNKNPVSPLTREPIHGGLSLGKESTHQKFSNYALANVFFGQKLVGNAELWLAIVYLVAEDVNYLSSNTDFMNAFKKAVVHRLTSSKTNITLSGLPIEPMIKTPTDIALWYCIISPKLYNLDTVDDARNRLRFYNNTAKHLMRLLDILNYPYDKEWTVHRVTLYSALTWMMNQEKANTNWRQLLRARYQNSIVIDGSVIMLDGPAVDRPSALDNLNLSTAGLITLSLLVDASKTNGVVGIPAHFQVKDVPKFVKNYCYAEVYNPSPRGLNPKTLRPHTIDPEKKLHWIECSERMFGPLKDQISAYNYFISYITEYKAYPSKEKFTLYMAQRQKNRLENAKDTLPQHIALIVDDVFNSYTQVLGEGFANISVETFIATTRTSQDKELRVGLEK